MTITTQDILQHHGIKGMKWGVRKEEPSNVTAAKQEVAKRRKEAKEVSVQAFKQTGGGTMPMSDKMAKKVIDTKRELRYAKEDLSTTKIMNKIKDKPKSESILKLEEKYKSKGMSDDEAAVAAYKHQRTKNALIVTGALALTVGAAYAGYKIHDANVDKLIKSGTKLQTVAADNRPIQDAFYTAKNSMDKVKYNGIFGQELRNRGNAQVFSKEIQVFKDIKQIAPKNAEKALKDLGAKNSKFAESMADYVNQGNTLGSGYEKIHANAMKSLSKGKIDKNVYEYFNATLVDHSPARQRLTDSYFKDLASKGYNAIRDVNDSKYSGYSAKNPMIAFNTAGKTAVVNVKQLADNEIKKANTVAQGSLIGMQLAKQGAVATGAILGSTKLVNSGMNKLNTKMANKYREENPGTKLSNTEIVRMLERGANS